MDPLIDDTLDVNAPAGWLACISLCAAVSTLVPLAVWIKQAVPSPLEPSVVGVRGGPLVSCDVVDDTSIRHAMMVRGRRFKALFLAMLTASNGLRFLFYFIQFVINMVQHQHRDRERSIVQLSSVWNEILFLLPPLLFFSTFSVILCFWSQLLKGPSVDSSRIDNAEPSGFFLGLNFLVYLSILLIGFTSLNFGMGFFASCLVFLGAIDLLAAFGCCVYGVTLTHRLRELNLANHDFVSDNVNSSRQSKILSRLAVFYIVSTGVFLLRCGMCVSMGIMSWERFILHEMGPWWWQLLMFSTTEWIPTLCLSWMLHVKQNPNNYYKQISSDAAQGYDAGNYGYVAYSDSSDDDCSDSDYESPRRTVVG
eukprot:TRINITY_DN16305_c0_g1_i1.p1 TRINITY_DN16305_c0_g1~~TRINITY_DN16305_c0_g1_i1.p1  ORF type:complete len:366 (-),score=85.45 TRINITY_DN16305_c0_g1_i1:68-1165(-)